MGIDPQKCVIFSTSTQMHVETWESVEERADSHLLRTAEAWSQRKLSLITKGSVGVP